MYTICLVEFWSSGHSVQVGAGPGDPELITARGLRRLSEADVVLYDALVHPDQLSVAGPDAELVFVGSMDGILYALDRRGGEVLWTFDTTREFTTLVNDLTLRTFKVCDEALQQAASFIQAIQDRQGVRISCVEEIAYRLGYIDRDQLRKLAANLMKNDYGIYLMELADESENDQK